jgi:hypothetical protein
MAETGRIMEGFFFGPPKKKFRRPKKLDYGRHSLPYDGVRYGSDFNSIGLLSNVTTSFGLYGRYHLPEFRAVGLVPNSPKEIKKRGGPRPVILGQRRKRKLAGKNRTKAPPILAQRNVSVPLQPDTEINTA